MITVVHIFSDISACQYLLIRDIDDTSRTKLLAIVKSGDHPHLPPDFLALVSDREQLLFDIAKRENQIPECSLLDLQYEVGRFVNKNCK